jgi:hypothetical protein
MSAPHPAYLSREAFALAELYQLRTVGEVASCIQEQRDADERARSARELCIELDLCDALTTALVGRAATERVVRAAAHRFRDWETAAYRVIRAFWRRGMNHPTLPMYSRAAAEIVDECMRLERAGLLERTIGGGR